MIFGGCFTKGGFRIGGGFLAAGDTISEASANEVSDRFDDDDECDENVELGPDFAVVDVIEGASDAQADRFDTDEAEDGGGAEGALETIERVANHIGERGGENAANESLGAASARSGDDITRGTDLLVDEFGKYLS